MSACLPMYFNELGYDSIVKIKMDAHVNLLRALVLLPVFAALR